jgi:hypothetical protein
MKNQKMVPYVDLQQTMRFYERLGFSSYAEEMGEDLYLVLECQDLVLKMNQEQDLNPFKNGHILILNSENVVHLSEQFIQQHAPEPTDCEGWVQKLKNGEVHIIDPNGNLLMISKKPED